MSQGITFKGIFQRAATTVDGGWRISFDVNPDETKAIMQLSCLRAGELQIGIVQVPSGSHESEDDLFGDSLSLDLDLKIGDSADGTEADRD